MEVEAFEFTFRQLLGAGDCDGFEHDPATCFGALLPRSLLTSSAVVPQDGRFEADLGAPLRNLMVDEPTLGKAVNASVRLTHMADFVYSLSRFPRNPFLGEDGSAISEAAQRGRRIFADGSTQCAQCHDGPSPENQLFTDKAPNASFDASAPPGGASNNPFKRQSVGTANVFDLTDPAAVAAADDAFQNPVGREIGRGIPFSRAPLVEYVTPVLNDVWNTPPYLHDGTAATLLDVVRPCNTMRVDCNQRGLGRNLNDTHGRTSHLTPQQLNDLVAFTQAPHGPLSARESVIRSGTLDLEKVRIKFGRRRDRGRFLVAGTLEAAVEMPTGGLGLTLGVPAGEAMAYYEFAAPPDAVRGRTRRRHLRTRTKAGIVAISLRGRPGGPLRLVARGRRIDLSALDTSARDLTVALTVGDVQFVQNRMLDATAHRRRILTLER
jgi:hypothetical protein